MNTSLQNTVVNNVLCYVSTARHSLSKDHIIKATVAYYEPIVIKAAKRVLYQLCNKEPIDRRRAAKAMLDAQDIYDLLNKSDIEKIILPKFVANSFLAMPPPTEFSELSNVIVTFMERVEQLEKEIKKSRESMQLDMKSFEDCITIKQELVDIKQNTMMLLANGSSPTTSPSIPSTDSANTSGTVPQMSIPAEEPGTANYRNALLSSPSRNNNQDRKQLSQSTRNAPSNTSSARGIIHSKQSANENRNITSSNNSASVRGSTSTTKYNNYYNNRGSYGTGRTRPSYNFRSAPKLVDVYVGRCITRTTCNDILNHCQEYLYVNPNSCVELNCKIPFTKSFKLTVDLSDRDYLLMPENWPRGVYVRKFYTAKFLTTTEQIQDY